MIEQVLDLPAYGHTVAIAIKRQSLPSGENIVTIMVWTEFYYM
jgi:hypothetical protein